MGLRALGTLIFFLTCAAAVSAQTPEPQTFKVISRSVLYRRGEPLLMDVFIPGPPQCDTHVGGSLDPRWWMGTRR